MDKKVDSITYFFYYLIFARITITAIIVIVSKMSTLIPCKYCQPCLRHWALRPRGHFSRPWWSSEGHQQIWVWQELSPCKRRFDWKSQAIISSWWISFYRVALQSLWTLSGQWFHHHQCLQMWTNHQPTQLTILSWSFHFYQALF